MKLQAILSAVAFSVAFYAVVYFVTWAAIDLFGWGFWFALGLGIFGGFGVLLASIGLAAWGAMGTPERQARTFKKFLAKSGNDLQSRGERLP